MAFLEEQVKELERKLPAKHVKTRRVGRSSLHYIEGWHAIAEANRIFGFDGWDRETVDVQCLWSGSQNGVFRCTYSARVKVRIRAGVTVIVREGTGISEGSGRMPSDAHEIAVKGAETDATKRALVTFGNRFGLALYDKQLSGVSGKQRLAPSNKANGRADEEWPLRSAEGLIVRTFDDCDAFATALRHRIQGAPDLDTLFGFWEQNVSLMILAAGKQIRGETGMPEDGNQLVSLLKSKARALMEGAAVAKSSNGLSRAAPGNQRARRKATRQCNGIDKSTLPLGEPKRCRSNEHLKFVARQACLVCGRSPCHAHHISFAQSKGLGRKVSDEYTVPLCATHHRNLHEVGDERKWWAEKCVDPLSFAMELWTANKNTGEK